MKYKQSISQIQGSPLFECVIQTIDRLILIQSTRKINTLEYIKEQQLYISQIKSPS